MQIITRLRFHVLALLCVGSLSAEVLREVRFGAKLLTRALLLPAEALRSDEFVGQIRDMIRKEPACAAICQIDVFTTKEDFHAGKRLHLNYHEWLQSREVERKRDYTGARAISYFGHVTLTVRIGQDLRKINLATSPEGGASSAEMIHIAAYHVYFGGRPTPVVDAFAIASDPSEETARDLLKLISGRTGVARASVELEQKPFFFESTTFPMVYWFSQLIPDTPATYEGYRAFRWVRCASVVPPETCRSK